MIEITDIMVVPVTEQGQLINTILYRWKGRTIYLDGKKKIKRFKHLLRWYLKHCHSVDVRVLLTYKEKVQ